MFWYPDERSPETDEKQAKNWLIIVHCSFFRRTFFRLEIFLAIFRLGFYFGRRFFIWTNFPPSSILYKSFHPVRFTLAVFSYNIFSDYFRLEIDMETCPSLLEITLKYCPRGILLKYVTQTKNNNKNMFDEYKFIQGAGKECSKNTT